MPLDVFGLVFGSGAQAPFKVAKDPGSGQRAFAMSPVDKDAQPFGTPQNPFSVAQSGIAGLTFGVSTKLEASHQFKASQGQLLSVYVQGNTVDAWLLLFDATALPIDGAVTPIDFCFCPAKAGGLLDWSSSPQPFANGLFACLSSGSDPFTKASGPTGAFKGAFA